MANSNDKKDANSVSTFGVMHKVLHNFGDWEIETYHMTRTERSIYFDMRTLYLKLGKPLTDDKELLSRRLRCTNDEELIALEFLLKDKFRHDKKTKTYRQSEWDLILKNYKFRHKTNNDETQYEHDEMGCEQNDETQNTNAERLKAYRERNKKIISSLSEIGIKANSRMTSKQLQALCKQHNIVIDEEMANNDETEYEHDEMGCEQKNEPINQAITNNQKPITNNQNKNNNNTTTAGEKNFQIEPQPAFDIKNWQAPDYDEFLPVLSSNNIYLKLTHDSYSAEVDKFKSYNANQVAQGKSPLVDDNYRMNKFIDWFKFLASKQVIAPTSQQPTIGDDDLPEGFRQATNQGYHPSHSKPTTAKPDPKTSVFLNGLFKPCFEGMTQEQTYSHIAMHKEAGETDDETYDRLAKELFGVGA